METENSTRKNPSRETCQKIIKRILVTEVLEKGCNEHFRQASDFMGYFQSLYPASDALTNRCSVPSRQWICPGMREVTLL